MSDSDTSVSANADNALETLTLTKTLGERIRTQIVPLDELCTRYVRLVVEAHNGNKTHAARALGIDRRSIYRWLAKAA